MATTKSQRLGIMAILIVTVVGTVGSFAVSVLATKNQAADDAKQKKAVADYKAATKKQNDELLAKYYPKISQFKSRAVAFDPAAITAVQTEDLVVGDGATVNSGSDYVAYYFGWNPKGVVFDGTDPANESKSSPLDPSMGLIPGWEEGVKGMKVGGVREISIPSDKAYGEKGSGDTIPPNTPLKFVVLAMPRPAQVPIPKELLQTAY